VDMPFMVVLGVSWP